MGVLCVCYTDAGFWCDWLFDLRVVGFIMLMLRFEFSCGDWCISLLCSFGFRLLFVFVVVCDLDACMVV